ncbi:MAG: 50S ribosomal protein L3 [Megasphaera sp.]|jgi:large subunit ribosomal protein L3|uniref:Large ribosomal subunit protein uL3 n=1 Tax=Megasphaera paucivorans TaxID=349095 RepID=A0A1G9X3W9_9FIRM|nr:50S ribosomal protein L3 [Megasphaera paucivorans]MCI1823315.1 50S ribosomal protein L3 [Megasphaera sp.]SDM91387.1 large subunit ribosomal protein L3 [Megasphaera paucivorans]
MSKAILGKKLGMTQIFTEEGAVVPVTVVEASPNVVVRVKTVDTDGYNSIQLGYGEVKEKHLTKPVKGQFDKAGVAPVKYLREVRLTETPEYTVGQTLAADIFASGDIVDVIGTSKGKGFAGTIKRHGFHRGPMAHGSKSHREPGSLGAMSSGGCGRVLKGKKLPGQMGGNQATVLHLSVVKVDMDKNLLLIKGGIPGAKGSLIMIRETVKPL